MSRSITEQDVLNFIVTLRSEFPNLSVKKEKPKWLRTLFSIPGINKLHWADYTQVIGSSIYLSDLWEEYSPSGKYITLKHEREHLRQFKKYTLVGMAFLYLFVIFPIGLAYFRAKFEREGKRAGLIARIECFGSGSYVREKAFKSYLKTFTSSSYLWAWPFESIIKKWFDEDWSYALRQ